MKNYSIGLDIGTGSVGWVCIDENYQILRYNNRAAFGVHEFETAHVAEERRIKRGARRRYNRRKKRIQLLQSLFVPHMQQKAFFAPTITEHYWKNDNQFENRTLSEVLMSLGMNPNTYPTIFHLRHELIESSVKKDARLIYLALHNLVKFRGHFLQEGSTWNANMSDANLSEQFEQLLHIYTEMEELPQVSLTAQQSTDVEHILLNNHISKAERARQLTALFERTYEPFFKLIVGLDIAAAQLFKQSEQQLLYKESKTKVNLTAETLPEVLQTMLEPEVAFIEAVQPFYQQTVLFDLLKGQSYVAAAKVEAFNQYERDLALLKSVINEVGSEKQYRAFFITSKQKKRQFEQKPNMELLCHLDRFNREKKYEETFYKEVSKLLTALIKEATGEVKEHIEQIIQAMESQSFLVKQKGIQNASIPYQNSLYEAEMILRNQQAYYPWITDEFIEKVKQLIAFRIPYYIGPLVQGDEQPFGWLQRQADGNITPWNFDEKVNKAASAESFITRMTKNCTYLKEEKVLPKQSLMYEKFTLLNELNSVQIRSSLEQPHKKHRLCEDMKQWIIEHVFKKTKTVTHKTLIQALKKSPYKDELYDESTGNWKDVYGTQKEDRFASSLSTYISLKEIVGDIVDNAFMEEIIYWLTVFTDRDIITLKMNDKYPFITEQQIQRLLSLNISGWGQLSQRLLQSIPVDDMNRSVIEYMEKHAVNFMELLSPRQSDLAYKIEQVNKQHSKKIHKIRYEDIEQLTGSPALKRGIWRSVKIIEELTAIFGEPKNIMIEVAREDQASHRTKSRKEQWESIGKSLAKEEKELKAFFKEMAQYPKQQFDRTRFWLYVTQQGKCLYTGKTLRLEDLSSYEIDHILPRNFVKDDSIDNLALVYPMANQEKNKAGNNKMPLEIIDAKQQPAMMAHWKRLNQLKLISDSKLHKLMKPSFNDVDKENFIARQLVETRQIIKHVRDLLQERFEHTDIHVVKAKMVSQFRKFSRIPKIRDYNNKHHAMDALFTTVLIQFILQKYGKNFLQFDLQHKDISKKWSKIAQSTKHFFLFQQFAEQQIKSPVTKELVSGVQYFEHIFYEQSWQTTKMTQTIDSNFYKETIFSPKLKTAKYTSAKAEKFVHDAIVKYAVCGIQYTSLKKNKEQHHVLLTDINVIEHYQLKEASLNELALHLAKRESKDDVIDAQMLVVIPKYKKIMLNGSPYYCISSDERHIATQFVLRKDLLEAVLHVNDETSVDELRTLFRSIVEEMMTQYKVYNKDTIRNKIDAFIETELIDVETFQVGFTEIKKMVAANAQRSDKFGGRLRQVMKVEDIYIIDESITGLRYRKPRKLVK
ncbi:type II CRISPR RNA-guided endonuclease Cas9 [Caryophanon latum]|uniref:CRISPR-associated endonuclease Cas9 n=1 Tax=Caryophanon latum TaxID=33977 RepID=A0A1C0YPC7_9BACL|nr:type II CRISPR RNA-guided endonuclease Cas9 [Caryophanon latum]OCS89018.1 type II CRISPR RNA-guided endonuclease Cas9 [Caryophanon latum]